MLSLPFNACVTIYIFINILTLEGGNSYYTVGLFINMSESISSFQKMWFLLSSVTQYYVHNKPFINCTNKLTTTNASHLCNMVYFTHISHRVKKVIFWEGQTHKMCFISWGIVYLQSNIVRWENFIPCFQYILCFVISDLYTPLVLFTQY